MDERRVKLAARMYEMRDSAKTMDRNYPETIKRWMGLLTQVAGKLRASPIQAVPMIAKAYPLSEMDIMWLTAAAVEMIEAEADRSK